MSKAPGSWLQSIFALSSALSLLLAAVLSGHYLLENTRLQAALSAASSPVQDSVLQLVDSAFTEDGPYVISTVTVRNIGEKIAVISRITVAIEKIWHFQNPGCFQESRRPVPQTHIILETNQGIYRKTLALPTAVDPNEWSQLSFNMSIDESSSNRVYGILFNVSVRHDTERFLSLPSRAVLATPIGFDIEYYFARSGSGSCYPLDAAELKGANAANLVHAAEIRSEGVEMGENLDRFLTELGRLSVT